MAKDYFHDIVPPASHHSHAHKAAQTEEDGDVTHIPIHKGHASESAGKSIRNITAPSRQRSRSGEEYAIPHMPRNRRSTPRLLLWVVATVCVLLLAALLFVALRPTRVTIEPRTHALNFSAETFTAHPQSAGTDTTFTYAVETIELEDSEVVASEGTVYAEEKASGNITVYNNYQTTPLRLVKNTRFETASGLIYRTPADVVVPAKVGSTPGKIDITVVADQPGEQYNVAPGKFTVPGLKSTPAMYAQVYAESAEAFVGGFVGERPGVAAGALESAIAAVRARLEIKARESAAQLADTLIALPELMQIEYQSLPHTSEAGGNVRIHQKARVLVPTFTPSEFAYAVSGSALSAGESSEVILVEGADFAAAAVGTSTVLGATPLNFSLSGTAMLVWHIDEAELQQALAGKDKSAFEAIVSGFTGVQEASARIEPFWKGEFPQDPEDIKIKVLEPQIAQ